MNYEPSFLWHDYETFGAHAIFDRPAQFAGIRTNPALEPVGEPINWYCQPARDVLPHPIACLVTGITPQEAQQKGLTEADFAAKIHAEMMEPGTCTAGYNSIHFDDEFSRNLFYRNFYDPYEREYKNNNSRWDLIDLCRMCYALRPAGITWPEHEPGKPSFRLEHLSAANNIEHEGAHEALSDVMATIGLARLIKRRQPRLFDWALKMRDQHHVMQMLQPASPKPLLHTSSRIPATRGCTTLVLPLSIYPDRKKSVIAYDLMQDPEPLLNLTPEEISDRLYTPAADLPEGVERIALKAIHGNHVPMIAPAAVLKNVNCARIGLDPERCFEHAKKLLAVLPQIRNKVMEVFKPYPPGADADPDHMIYSGGFFSQHDRRLMDKIRNTDPALLAQLPLPFKDGRLTEMLFRYRARNFPETLGTEENRLWQEQRLQRLNQPTTERQLDPETFRLEIVAARQAHQGDHRAQNILDHVEAWGNEICNPI
ncbi:MAG: exodeoxyribonuclease I [Xanthomonadales bacterium]|nr:exodeoxyribonuclease I [Gammaproteobacteria bacterium]NNK05654.1 exodeoxyribonuclease I [Xanthomonadales bacterium]